VSSLLIEPPPSFILDILVTAKSMMRRLAILAAVVSTVCGAVLVKRDIPDENRCLQASKLEEEDLYDPTLRVACQSLVIISARISLHILILVLHLRFKIAWQR
jgi:hypothetical protein